MIPASTPRGMRVAAAVLTLVGTGAILAHGYRLASGLSEPGILSLVAMFAGLYLCAWLGHYGLFGCGPGHIKR